MTIQVNHAVSEGRRSEYLSFRRRYEPERITLAIIAESPPVSGEYFHNPTGTRSEPLFVALMQQLCLSPLTKQSGLTEFQRNGWVLVDATYEAVNKRSNSARDKVIARDYPLLRDDLTGLISDRNTPLILIKANVCRLLEPKLVEDRFNVLNRGSCVYFPGSGRQPDFHRQFGAIVKSAGIPPRCWVWSSAMPVDA